MDISSSMKEVQETPFLLEGLLVVSSYPDRQGHLLASDELSYPHSLLKLNLNSVCHTETEDMKVERDLDEKTGPG